MIDPHKTWFIYQLLVVLGTWTFAIGIWKIFYIIQKNRSKVIVSYKVSDGHEVNKEISDYIMKLYQKGYQMSEMTVENKITILTLMKK